MNFSLKPTTIKSKKTGKEYLAYKLTLGDFEKIFFPVGNMERNYLANNVGDGIEVEVE